MKRALLRTDFSPAECLERLARVSEAPRWINNPFRGERPPLVLKGKGPWFWIRKNIAYNNPIQPVLRVKIDPRGKGTRIDGRFELNPWVFWMLTAWYALIAWMLFVESAAVTGDPARIWALILATAVMMAAPTLVWALGALLARGEKEFLEGALAEALNAEPGMWEDDPSKKTSSTGDVP